MKKILIPIVLAIAAVSCAGLSVKQKAHNAHMSVRSALVAVDEFERGMCQPAPAAVNTCTAKPVLITDQQHQQVSRLLREAFEADARLGAAIIAWKPGAPVPTDLPSLEQLVTQLEQIALALSPTSAAAELITRVRALVSAVATTSAAFGGAR